MLKRRHGHLLSERLIMYVLQFKNEQFRGCFKFCLPCVNHWNNFNRTTRCSSDEQQPLETVGKTGFWNRKKLAILTGEFTFVLMGRSFTVISTCLSIRQELKMNLDSPRMVKIRLKIVNNSHFAPRVTCSVHVDRFTGHMLGWDSASQPGPVLNHPLGLIDCNFGEKKWPKTVSPCTRHYKVLAGSFIFHKDEILFWSWFFAVSL